MFKSHLCSACRTFLNAQLSRCDLLLFLVLTFCLRILLLLLFHAPYFQHLGSQRPAGVLNSLTDNYVSKSLSECNDDAAQGQQRCVSIFGSRTPAQKRSEEYTVDLKDNIEKMQARDGHYEMRQPAEVALKSRRVP